ncbi:8-oxo-dGTP diphosphatase MutT [Pseudoalteromonas sp. OOF1S-7]|uniref:8-oxo-dGTP diphosphatase MutT n=1 Tax=Pseudoalteromonas sp. OOF1S-7 TaxID=2917757 RepID=UPI001EF4D4D8|nr:8-oxo-dGTP diphosphatase MutT [Pseudoalteromonas sp. OOF1S-7]MCG7536378.1 8-oxo-dGTP diphosphatase MutT [Pseudoalteromonas sp. OOF1S-7]
MTKKVVNVAVGVIVRDAQFFVCKRAKEQHQGGLWEFPGGKIEAQESVTQALARELKEEIGIDVHGSEHLLTIEHDYGDKQVKLEVHKVEDFSGQATGLEGQPSQWVSWCELKQLAFPAANVAILDALAQYYDVLQ